jgi:hypothetical protein
VYNVAGDEKQKALAVFFYAQAMYEKVNDRSLPMLISILQVKVGR